MIEIFSRMPAKSVGKFRCLSKSWNYHLSTSQFIKLHLTRKIHQQNLIFITQSNSLHTITTPFENNAVYKKLELDNTWSEVLGSCHGLVLLANKKRELCLLNPLTTQKVNIPDCDLALKTGYNYKIHGFGYDSSHDDYKIVAIPIYNPSSVLKPSDKFVDVYSVRMGVWNRVKSYAAVYGDISCNEALVNGAIHCFAVSGDDQTIIAAFNFANEVFYEIPTPPFINGLFYSLFVLGERLCLVDILCGSYASSDVWTMEEYGSVKSWTKLCSFGEIGNLDVFEPLYIVRDNEIVFLTRFGMRWIVCNMKEGTVKKLVDGVPFRFMSGGIFFDSLVSLG